MIECKGTPANKFMLQIQPPNAINNEFVTILNLTDFSVSSEAKTVDAGDFSSDGYGSELVVGRNVTITASQNYGENENTGDKDAGQVALEYFNGMVGCQAVTKLQLVYPSKHVVEFNTSVSITELSGDKDGLATQKLQFNTQGKPIKVPFIPVSSITIVPTDIVALPVGNEETLVPSILPLNTSNTKVDYFIDDDTIASLHKDEATQECKVIGLKVGTTDIQAITVNGNHIAIVPVEVV